MLIREMLCSIVLVLVELSVKVVKCARVVGNKVWGYGVSLVSFLKLEEQIS